MRTEKDRERQRRYYMRNKERILARRRQDPRKKIWYRAANLKKYGLTVENYESMLHKQGGKCAICGAPPYSAGHPRQDGVKVYRLGVDHDHETGRVRGLLCTVCNRGLGFLETREWRKQAEAYLNG